MIKNLLCLIICLLFVGNYNALTAVARQIETEAPLSLISCFSGTKEILREKMVSGPLADEYKFAREIRVKDDQGEHRVNFSGGLCIIDHGETSNPRSLAITDRLSCYSGGEKIIAFEVYGRETTVDEYIEGRTFLAKATGRAFSFEPLHEYLVFGAGACIGMETGN